MFTLPEKTKCNSRAEYNKLTWQNQENLLIQIIKKNSGIGIRRSQINEIEVDLQRQLIKQYPSGNKTENQIKEELKNRGIMLHRGIANTHISTLKNKSQITEIDHKLFWKEQYERKKCLEELIDKMILKLENDPETGGLTNAYLMDRVLMFIPKLIDDKNPKHPLILEYVLFHPSIAEMDNNAQETWDCGKNTREILDMQAKSERQLK